MTTEVEMVEREGEVARQDENLDFEIEQNAFRHIVKLVERLDDESVLITASASAMRFYAMNEENTAFVLGFINKGSFMKYDLTKDTAFALELKNLKAVLALADKKSLVRFSKHNESVVMESDDGFKQEFNVSAYGKTLNIPNIEYKEGQGALVDLEEFFEVVKYAKDVAAPIVKLQVDGGSLVMGFYRGSVKLEKNIRFKSGTMENNTTAIYPINELFEITKGIWQMCGKSQVMLRMKDEDEPLKVSYRLDLDKSRSVKGYGLVSAMVRSSR